MVSIILPWTHSPSCRISIESKKPLSSAPITKFLATVRIFFFEFNNEELEFNGREKNHLERESSKVLYQNLFCRVFDLQMILNWYKHVKSLKMTSSFNLKRVIKIARWRCGTKISKTNLKAIISPLVTHPQGCQGCQKIWKTQLKTTLVSWSAKIQSKLNRIQKTFRKQGFFENFCPILTVFHSFFNSGWILALQFTRVDFSLVVWIFTPLAPLEASQ